jgi:hypothetical protein
VTRQSSRADGRVSYAYRFGRSRTVDGTASGGRAFIDETDPSVAGCAGVRVVENLSLESSAMVCYWLLQPWRASD